MLMKRVVRTRSNLFTVTPQENRAFSDRPGSRSHNPTTIYARITPAIKVTSGSPNTR